jgi:hypothetical protein
MSIAEFIARGTPSPTPSLQEGEPSSPLGYAPSEDVILLEDGGISMEELDPDQEIMILEKDPPSLETLMQMIPEDAEMPDLGPMPLFEHQADQPAEMYVATGEINDPVRVVDLTVQPLEEDQTQEVAPTPVP